MTIKEKKQVISLTIDKLEILKQVYTDDIMPSMIDDGDFEDRIEEIDNLIFQLKQIKKDL